MRNREFVGTNFRKKYYRYWNLDRISKLLLSRKRSYLGERISFRVGYEIDPCKNMKPTNRGSFFDIGFSKSNSLFLKEQLDWNFTLKVLYQKSKSGEVIPLAFRHAILGCE